MSARSDWQSGYPVCRNVRALALAVSALSCGLALPASALVITQIGPNGGAGAAGPIGANGAAGGGAQAEFSSTDLDNTATATGGLGGRGGDSQTPVTGGSGGAGGAASAQITSGDQAFNFENSAASDATATGGRGGDGGSGASSGNGGDGGAAQSRVVDHGRTEIGEEDPTASVSGRSAATGGDGGLGATGGNGGAADAALDVIVPYNGGSGGTTTAVGGRGGDGVVQGGNGGAARADNSLQTGGMPSMNSSRANATAGAGGSVQNGANGNGGDAFARAYGTHSARDLGIEVGATAQGGNAGSGGSPASASGRGGNAIAQSDGYGDRQYADSYATATGGNGAEAGGYAVAEAKHWSAVGGYASALAQGGSGREAGAALATASGYTDVVSNHGSAVARYAGPFAREVAVSADLSRADDIGPSTIFVQAHAGDTRGLSAPTAGPGQTTQATAAIAPLSPVVDAALAGHDAIAAAFAGATVWGIGESSAQAVSLNELSFAYQFDVSDYSNPGHLWLGLLDADFSAENFEISIDGVTLLSGVGSGGLVDDQLIDLGEWFERFGSDGIVDLRFDFSNIVGNFDFALADVGNTTAVPEPSALWLLMPGLALLVASRARRDA